MFLRNVYFDRPAHRAVEHPADREVGDAEHDAQEEPDQHPPRAACEDLVQEVFIRVHRHLHRFDRSKKFSTWVYTIASNLAKNELRNRSRNPLVLFQTMQGDHDEEDRPLQFEDTTSRPDDLFRRRHLRELVEDTVAKLPEHHRQVFVLRELEGKSYEEIAEITSCNLGTVKSRLNRARTAFAAIIEPYID